LQELINEIRELKVLIFSLLNDIQGIRRDINTLKSFIQDGNNNVDYKLNKVMDKFYTHEKLSRLSVWDRIKFLFKGRI